MLHSRTRARAVLAVSCLALFASATLRAEPSGSGVDPFRQLDDLLPTPNEARTASGAPGPGYWQQRADYVIGVEIDDRERRLSGTATITYHNRSPHDLQYVWLQLENNVLTPGSDAALSARAPGMERMSYSAARRLLARQRFDGGVKIGTVRDEDGGDLSYSIVKTMMRIDLPAPLTAGESLVFSVDWSYAINDSKLVPARTGYEHFSQDDNCIYELAHWYPRLAAYTDVDGWQHKQFLGRGEFTLEFGDFLVRITVPDDHTVAATGVLQNPEEVLSVEQRQRLDTAAGASKPVFVVTPEEAVAREASRSEGKKTWIFHARNVRDFAFASSRKFIWDAQGHEVDGRRVMAMSFFPKESEPLWSLYSTHAIIHTLDVYSRYTFAYPYPVAISVNGPVGGMEYPMICFNGPRPEPDGTYSKRTKYSLISVVIHEVGHNFFPMIVNSDERQWTWMDEGLNTFLQFRAEQEWEEGYPSRRGEPQDIVRYMLSEEQVPIMTNSESILQFHSNAYAKPATALNILRETVLGRELFDHAFREYARRWQFKRPQPADFFRTLEDASGIDLDWFWRGWFYTTDHVDIAIEDLRHYVVDTKNPDVEKPRRKDDREAGRQTVMRERNRDVPKRAGKFEELKDFYNSYDELDVTEEDRKSYRHLLEGLEDEEKELLAAQYNFYVVDLRNVGGLVMPVIIEIEYGDGSREELRIPAEIWRFGAERVSKLVIAEQTIRSLTLDPRFETADADLENNHFPPRVRKSRFQLYKERRGKNPMQRQMMRDKREKRESTSEKASESPKEPAPEAAAAEEEEGR